MKKPIAVNIEKIDKGLLLIILDSSCLFEIKQRRGKTGGIGESFNQIRPAFGLSRIMSFDGKQYQIG